MNLIRSRPGSPYQPLSLTTRYILPTSASFHLPLGRHLISLAMEDCESHGHVCWRIGPTCNSRTLVSTAHWTSRTTANPYSARGTGQPTQSALDRIVAFSPPISIPVSGATGRLTASAAGLRRRFDRPNKSAHELAVHLRCERIYVDAFGKEQIARIFGPVNANRLDVDLI